MPSVKVGAEGRTFAQAGLNEKSQTIPGC